MKGLWDRSRSTRVSAAVRIAAAFLLAGFSACAPHPRAALHGTALQGDAPDFALSDGSAQRVRLSALRGAPVLLFFGYTHCPDICPATLAVFAQAKKQLGSSGAHVNAIFVSVDPKRDSPAGANEYARRFDPAFHGVSGSEAELAPVKAAYHIYSQALPETAPGIYALAHSSSVYVIDASGRLRELLPWNVPIADLQADLAQLVAE